MLTHNNNFPDEHTTIMFMLYHMIESKLSTAFHSQTDKQTKRVNQKLEQYLRIFINHRQEQWSDVRLANSKAGIKPTAPLSAFDKENLIEFPLDFLYYLYNYYIVCALLSHAYHVTSHDVML